MNKKINTIDLFCGAGGMSRGFEESGFHTIFAVESNRTYAETFKKNFPKTEMFIGDIKKISNNEISKLAEKNNIEIIIGGPPCQGFSIAGNIGRKFLDDERNALFLEFVRFVEIIKPKMFVLENVANLLTHNKGKTIKEIVDKFSDVGYLVKYDVLNSVNYNVPQERRRIFIVGTINSTEFNFPKKSKKIVTIKDAIGDLPKLKSGEVSEITLHTAMSHSQQMLDKMKYIKDGGDRLDIPESIRPKTGDVRKYVRYNSSKPSFCVTGDMRKIFHYNQNRALTKRELARLQTFPDSFEFVGNSIEIQQQIGNAVPVKLAKAIARECKRALINV